MLACWLGCAAVVRAGEAAATVMSALPDYSERILTPSPSPAPRLTGPRVFGVRPGHPLVHRITATGERPMTFSAEGLPDGVTLDSATGLLSGALAKAG